MWLIVDCPFNEAWYPNLIGQIFDNPPAYAIVRELPNKIVY